MLKEQTNSKKQGDVGLGVAIGWFSMNGYTVCVPLTDSQEYDLIVDSDDGVQKVQVKTVYAKKVGSGNYEVRLRTCGGNRSGTSRVKMFNPEKVDLLFVLTEDGEKFLIPSSKIKNASSITLSGKWNGFVIE